MPNNLPNREQFRMLTEELIKVVTHPEFSKAVAELQALAPSARAQAFDRIAGVNALKMRGIEMPASVRTSPRYFEDPRTGTVDLTDPGVPFWIRRDMPVSATEQAAALREQPAIPLYADTPVDVKTLAGLTRGLGICVSGGYGVCLSVGYAF
jgi:hypothetical protein